MKCIKCSNEHDGSFGSGKFCSRACANSRERSTETKRKIAESVRKTFDEGKAKIAVLSKEQRQEAARKGKETWNQKLLEADFSILQFRSLRKRLILEQKGKCNCCGLSEWLGQPIPLEVDHKDGNHHNNSRENVEAICANCHSLTPTWRGRNKKCLGGRQQKVSDEAIIEAFVETGNIRQCLLKVGLAAKGSNYGRVKRCLTLNGIPYSQNNDVH